MADTQPITKTTLTEFSAFVKAGKRQKVGKTLQNREIRVNAFAKLIQELNVDQKRQLRKDIGIAINKKGYNCIQRFFLTLFCGCARLKEYDAYKASLKKLDASLDMLIKKDEQPPAAPPTPPAGNGAGATAIVTGTQTNAPQNNGGATSAPQGGNVGEPSGSNAQTSGMASTTTNAGGSASTNSGEVTTGSQTEVSAPKVTPTTQGTQNGTHAGAPAAPTPPSAVPTGKNSAAATQHPTESSTTAIPGAPPAPPEPNEPTPPPIDPNVILKVVGNSSAGPSAQEIHARSGLLSGIQNFKGFRKTQPDPRQQSANPPAAAAPAPTGKQPSGATQAEENPNGNGVAAEPTKEQQSGTKNPPPAQEKPNPETSAAKKQPSKLSSRAPQAPLPPPANEPTVDSILKNAANKVGDYLRSKIQTGKTPKGDKKLPSIQAGPPPDTNVPPNTQKPENQVMESPPPSKTKKQVQPKPPNPPAPAPDKRGSVPAAEPTVNGNVLRKRDSVSSGSDSSTDSKKGGGNGNSTIDTGPSLSVTQRVALERQKTNGQSATAANGHPAKTANGAPAGANVDSKKQK